MIILIKLVNDGMDDKMAAFADTDILGSTIREEKTDMRKKSIFRQMLIPMIAVIGLLAAIIITIFIAAYEKDI